MSWKIAISILFGLVMGVSIALTILAYLLHKSNNLGDSKATLHHFGLGNTHFTHYIDDAKRDTPLTDLENPVILAHDHSSEEA